MPVTQDFATLEQRLTAWDRRRRLASVLRWTPRGVLTGLMGAAIVATAGRLVPVLTGEELATLSLGLALFGALLGFSFTYFRRNSLLDMALFADRQFALSERAGTAVEIQSGLIQTSPHLVNEQIGDAVRVAAAVNTASGLPLRLHRRDISLIILAGILLLAAILVPNPQVNNLLQRRALADAVNEQIQALEDLSESISANTVITGEQQQELLAPIQDALSELREGDLSREQLVAVLSEAEADLRSLGETSNDALSQALRGAGEPLTRSNAGRELGEQLAAGDLAAAGAAANRLADNLSELDAGEQADLSRQLFEAAEAIREIDSELASELSDAARALQEGDVAAAEQALRETAGTLRQRAGEQSQADLANAAADQLNQGRDAIAQAGQPAMPGEGQGQGQGQGEIGQAAGLPGESGVEQGGDRQDEQAGGPGPGGGHVDSVYAPELVDLSDETGIDVELAAECRANPERCGALIGQTATEFSEEESLIPYDQVFGDYRDAAYQALESDHVPLTMKSLVRDYFSTLEP